MYLNVHEHEYSPRYKGLTVYTNVVNWVYNECTNVVNWVYNVQMQLIGYAMDVQMQFIGYTMYKCS